MQRRQCDATYLDTLDAAWYFGICIIGGIFDSVYLLLFGVFCAKKEKAYDR